MSDAMSEATREANPGRASAARSLTVTQVRSGQHAKPKTRGTLRALGLGRIGRTNTLPDRPEIRGMLARVPHLVDVEEHHDDQAS
jgi:large subunit ribosomal protein L30